MAMIYVTDNYDKILPWLQENVGDLLHSQPIIFWHGEGWHMKRVKCFGYVENSRLRNWHYEVTIDDEQKATWFTLLWA